MCAVKQPPQMCTGAFLFSYKKGKLPSVGSSEEGA